MKQTYLVDRESKIQILDIKANLTRPHSIDVRVTVQNKGNSDDLSKVVLKVMPDTGRCYYKETIRLGRLKPNVIKMIKRTVALPPLAEKVKVEAAGYRYKEMEK